MSKSVIDFETVDQWAQYTIKAFMRELKKKKLVLSGALYNSFKRELRRSKGDVAEVMIKFAMYGRFRDMGVGRGLKAWERKTNKANLIGAKAYGAEVSYVRRQPKRWYPKVKTHEIYRLGEILARDMGDDFVKWMGKEFSTGWE